MMEEKEFLSKMEELMDTEKRLSMNSILNDIEEWDSLSYVAFLAIYATSSSRAIAPSDVKNAETIYDLYKLIKISK